jgi:hypothetical protein
MAASRIPSATIALSLHSSLKQRTVSRLPCIAQCFRPVYSRASCSWAQNSISRCSRVPTSFKSSQVVRLDRVGTFSTTVNQRSKREDATSSSSGPQQVGHGSYKFLYWRFLGFARLYCSVFVLKWAWVLFDTLGNIFQLVVPAPTSYISPQDEHDLFLLFTDD